jgi:tetratricopeptide (TPR) repeat protein
MITITNCTTAWMLPLVAGLVLAGRSARAQSTDEATASTSRAQLDEPVPEENRPEDRPWALGVSIEQRKRARVLYQAGNRFLADSLFAAAVTKYRAALQHWNHPGIHYNLALSLISLDRPIEAYASIAAALRYGPDALHPEEYRRALDYQRLLRRQIAEVEVVCHEPGADVTLDGTPLFTGPGQITTFVLPGKHQIGASKASYITTNQAFTVAAAARTQVELHLLAEHQATRQVRHWPSWMPWAVNGAGLGAVAAAAALHRQSGINAQRLISLSKYHCKPSCERYPAILIPLKEQVERQRNSAYAGYATASVLLAAGALLTYFNRPQTVDNQALHDLVRISVGVGGPEGSPGVSVQFPF